MWRDFEIRSECQSETEPCGNLFLNHWRHFETEPSVAVQ